MHLIYVAACTLPFACVHTCMYMYMYILMHTDSALHMRTHTHTCRCSQQMNTCWLEEEGVGLWVEFHSSDQTSQRKLLSSFESSS